MGIDKARKQARDNEYIKEHYTRITLAIDKDKAQAIKQAAAEAGQNVTAYIMQAVFDRMNSSFNIDLDDLRNDQESREA